jgi:hypothetical protein
MVETEQAILGVVLLALVVFGVYSIYRAFGDLQRGWSIWQSDPIGAGEIEYEDGIVEVQGTVEQLEGELLTTEYTDTPAVAHEYKLQRKNTDQELEGEPEWETVESGTETQPFYVTDETGSVAGGPDGAAVSLDTEQISGDSEFNIGPVEASTSKMYEGLLAPGDQVHVFGQKRNSQGGGPGGEKFYIADGGEADAFSISDTTEARTVMRYLGKGVLWLVFGLAALGASGVLALVVAGQLELADIGLQVTIPLAQPLL